MKKHLIRGIGLIAILWMVIGVKETWSILRIMTANSLRS